MQSTVDGDVRLSVGLDTKAAENDLKNISNDVKKILQALENQSDKLSSKFDTLNNSVSSIATSLTDLQRHFASITSISLPVEQLSRLATGITGVNSQLATTATQEQAVVEAAENVSSSMQTVADNAAAARENIQQAAESTANVGVNENQFADIDAVAERLAELEARQRELSSQGITTGSEWEEVAQQLRDVEAEYNRLDKYYETIEVLTNQINILEQAVENYHNRLNELSQQDAFNDESQEAEELNQKLLRTAILLDTARANLNYVRSTGRTDYQANAQRIAAAQAREAEQREREQQEILRQIEALTPLTEAELREAEAINQNTAAVERNAHARHNATAMPSTTAPDTSEQENRLLRIANIAGTVTSRLSGFTSALSKFFGRISSVITKSSKDTDKGFKNINKSINRGIVNLLKYTLGIRSIYILFNKLRRAGIDSFKSLVKQSEPLNKTISETYSAFINLKNAIGPAFQPLVSVVAPILTRLADSLTSVTYKLGEFFAALTGQSYIYKAIKAQKDYAKSLDKTSDKLKDNLASFDKLNVLSDKNKDTDEDKVQYEITPISDTFSTLKSLIDAQDWEGIGQRIAERINIGLEAVKKALSWDNIGGTVTGFVLAFTGIFNSLVANINWDLLGQTVGEGVNTIVNTLNLLLTGIDWVNLGASLATGLNSMITTVNWTNVGQLLGNWFMKSWKIFSGFVKNLDFSKIGKAIADGINGFFKTFNFSTVTSSVATFVNGLSTALLNFVSETNWGKTVDNISGGINTALFETDWGQLASGLSKSLTTLLDTFIETVANIDWQKVGSSVIQFIANIDWGGLVNNLFKATGTILGGIEGFLVGALGEIFQGIRAFFLEKLKEAGGNIFLGILYGIRDAIIGIGTWIWENIFKPFYDGVCKAFGIASPAKSMLGIGEFIIKGLLNGLVNTFVKIWEWLKSLPEKFKDGFIKIVEAIKQPFKNIADWFKNIFSKAWEAVRNVFSTGGKIFNGIKEGIANVFKTVVNSLIDGINTIIAVPFDTVNNMLNTIRNVTIPIINKQPFAGLWGENPLPVPQIPKLAQGTVVPANFGSFLAELGDNKREPEIVSPVSKIEEAVENVLKRTGNFFSGDGKIEINLNVDGRTLYSVIVSQDEIERKRHGGKSRLGTAVR